MSMMMMMIARNQLKTSTCTRVHCTIGRSSCFSIPEFTSNRSTCTRVDFYTKLRMCGRSAGGCRLPGAGCRVPGHGGVVSSVQKVVEVSTSKESLVSDVRVNLLTARYGGQRASDVCRARASAHRCIACMSVTRIQLYMYAYL